MPRQKAFLKTSFVSYVVLSEVIEKDKNKTFNNGSLGSCIDEERSEMR